MKQIIFLFNLIGLGISVSYFILEQAVLGDSFYSLISHLVLGIFQFIFSLVYFFKRDRTNRILDIHFMLSSIYLVLAIIARNQPSLAIDEEIALGLIPCLLAFLFTLGFAKLLFTKSQNRNDWTSLK
jgi:hypothetical protein